MVLLPNVLCILVTDKLKQAVIKFLDWNSLFLILSYLIANLKQR